MPIVKIRTHEDEGQAAGGIIYLTQGCQKKHNKIGTAKLNLAAVNFTCFRAHHIILRELTQFEASSNNPVQESVDQYWPGRGRGHKD